MKGIGEIKCIVFDLDGTITDSKTTILKSTRETLNELQIAHSFSDEEFISKIGLHFYDIFEDLEIEVPDLEEFLQIYQKYYSEFLSETTIFPGVILSLEYLRKRKKKIALLTTKSQKQADQIIDHFNLRKYFDVVVGRRPEFRDKPDPEPLLYICSYLDCLPEETVVIGDTEVDIRCAKMAYALSGAVLHGYRTWEELEREEPDFLIDETYELKPLLISLIE